MILSSTSIKVALMILLFASLISTGGNFYFNTIFTIPFQLILGAIIGFLFGHDKLLIVITSILLTATISSILIDKMTPTMYE